MNCEVRVISFVRSFKYNIGRYISLYVCVEEVRWVRNCYFMLVDKNIIFFEMKL